MPTGRKLIALSYDDGPDPKMTPKLLELLKSLNVPATFFLQGINVKHFPSLVRQELEDGFEIGNHTYDHPQLTKLSREKITSQLQTTNDLITSITQQKIELMRPPYGAQNSTVREICKDMGYKVINWDIDTNDWRGRSSEQIIETIMKGAHDGSIILMHDRFEKGKPTILEATQAVVPALRAKGYTFVTVGEMLKQARQQSGEAAGAGSAGSNPVPASAGDETKSTPTRADNSSSSSAQVPVYANSTVPPSPVSSSSSPTSADSGTSTSTGK
jgi:peptidoglycan/xylan/chitin deacetylase (PgdA/CDA1 family)